jgi:hypothetical protein
MNAFAGGVLLGGTGVKAELGGAAGGAGGGVTGTGGGGAVDVVVVTPCHGSELGGVPQRFPVPPTAIRPGYCSWNVVGFPKNTQEFPDATISSARTAAADVARNKTTHVTVFALDIPNLLFDHFRGSSPESIIRAI